MKNIKKILKFILVLLLLCSSTNASIVRNVIDDVVQDVIRDAIDEGVDIFSGTLYQRNTDTTFSVITTGSAHEISNISATDPGEITFVGGRSLLPTLR